ncbi:MAG: hypothetical protein Q7W55_13355 [Pseudohongiella sp.]|nr:hypothetical protein [Pseudohongiella sp.]MDO9518865.1 hypothetical protein [Pseudohongiella sp.]MDP2128841.1 hypothetical protein [Pseudohongiella sp.]
MTSSQSDIKVREAIGVFFDREHLEEAIKDLKNSGFEHDQLGLLASEQVVQKSLGDIYTRTNDHDDDSKGPAMAFARKEAGGDNFWSFNGGLFFAGSTAAMGAVVASAAVFGGALLVAAASVVGVGTVGAVAANLISKSDAESLAEQVDQGHLLLFVRVNDLDEEASAVRILSRHAGFDAKVYEVPVK